jgi:hypothetical protein
MKKALIFVSLLYVIVTVCGCGYCVRDSVVIRSASKDSGDLIIYNFSLTSVYILTGTKFQIGDTIEFVKKGSYILKDTSACYKIKGN